MGVLTCTLLRGRDFSMSDDATREHNERYQILCHEGSNYSPFQAAKLATKIGPNRLPDLYGFHPQDRIARARTISVKQDDAKPNLFIATVKYDTKYDITTNGVQNPLARPPRYFLELMQFERPVAKDINGRPIENALGKPFDPPIMQDDSRQVLVAVRNVANIFQLTALQQTYKDAINTNPFYGAKPRQAKVVSITSGEEKTEGNYRYYEVAIRIAFKEEGETWIREILHTGMSRNKPNPDQTDGAPRFIETTKLKNGEQINSPVKLAKDGTQLPDGADPVYLKFKTYPERDFRGLGI